MDSAAPLFLPDRPPSLPIGKAIGAVVWVSWRWRLCRETTDVVMGATPGLLARIPARILSHRAVVGVDRADWSRWLRHWLGDRLRYWSGRWCGRGSWRLRGEGRRWHSWRCLRQSCCGRGRGATPANSVAAERLLLRGPTALPPGEASVAIKQSSRHISTEQPVEQRNQQQQA